jgi:hypothetical protein
VSRPRAASQNWPLVPLARINGVAAVVFLLAAACGEGTGSVSFGPKGSPSPPVPVHCVSSDGLPDRVCTPGAANANDVTQATIKTTICVSGYTSHGIRSDGQPVRPPAAYTDNLKLQGIVAYGYEDPNPADYEEDHLIPLQLGGDGYDQRNLWPQPRYGPHPASAKTPIETHLHDLICSGVITLASAQIAIANNWETALTIALPKPSPRPSPSASTKLFVKITASNYGFLEATTLAGASCTAKARLPSGNYSKAQGLQVTATADDAGDVSWAYNTSSQTRPGTGTHYVTCTLGSQKVSAFAPFTVS